MSPDTIGWVTILALASLMISFGDAIVCYKCDSVTLGACATSLLDEVELPYEDCKTSLQCAMSIVDSVTYRGCAYNTPTVGATYRKSCPDNLCNKGVFPPGRLKCYQCAGKDCVAQPIGKPHPCLYHHEVDHCFTEIVDENEVYRGCKSDNNRTIADKAVYCDINGCNNQVGAAKLKCGQCDSKEGRGCKMDLFEVNANPCNISQYGICEVPSLLTRPETCFLYHNKDRVVRGCTKTLPEDLKGDKEHLHECGDQDHCNAKCLKQRRCLICDSTLNLNCRDNTSAITVSTCGSAEDSSCFGCEVNNWQVRRGCGSPPLGADITRCYECDKENEACNVTPFTRCYKCSSATNVNCATWERPGFVDIEECEVPGAACVMAALPNGDVVRGCESPDLNCNTTSTSCSACEGSFCNKGPYPPHRLRCFQCAGHSCAVNTLKRDPMPCLQETLHEAEACFEYIDAEKRQVVRGCRSDSENYYQCLLNDSDADGCHLCFEDGCNANVIPTENNGIINY